MALHTYCATDIIFHILWQKFLICMMFGMNLSCTIMSHAQSKTGQYFEPVPILIGNSTISLSLEPFPFDL